MARSRPQPTARPFNRSPLALRAKEVGLKPGSLVHVGTKKVETPIISLIDYGPDHLDRVGEVTLKQASSCRQTESVSWINLSGIHDTQLIASFGRHFDIHALALEDILNTQHRPKAEALEEQFLVILKMLFFDDTTQSIRSEQISMVLGAHYLITFQEFEGDVFDGVRARLQNEKGKLRRGRSDYLAYALIDSIIDSYFQILESIGDCILALEEKLTGQPDQELLRSIHHYKREMISLRKAVWPLRELVSGLQRDDSPLISETTRPYLADVYDHTIQVIETTEIYRDTLSGLLDLYLSSVSNRMNEVMKVLTIIATLFIPLTFIVGVYGMNFEFMPELKWPWGYPAIWLLMIGSVALMLRYFRRNGWF
jgi:magnesium transporter